MLGLCSQKRKLIRLLCHQDVPEHKWGNCSYLPIKISRPTKFLLGRDADVNIVLRILFFTGILEILCLVEVFMPHTIKNKEIISNYEKSIEALYQEKDVWPVIGSILVCNQPHEPVDVEGKGTKERAATQ